MSIRHRPFCLLLIMARLAGIEPTTPWFVAKYSIQLSYSREEKDYSRVLFVLGSCLAISANLLLLSFGTMIDIMPSLMDLLAQFASLLGRQLGRRAIALLIASPILAPRLIASLALRCVLARPAVAPPGGRFGMRRPQCKEQRGQAQPGGQALHDVMSRMYLSRVRSPCIARPMAIVYFCSLPDDGKALHEVCKAL